ncbi:hypothetical protein Bbelb_278400 [Branchiostoma belcheri]|nr:hypothetical protein Bbelb_278400 [Branchiostoma belcheri]
MRHLKVPWPISQSAGLGRLKTQRKCGGLAGVALRDPPVSGSLRQGEASPTGPESTDKTDMYKTTLCKNLKIILGVCPSLKDLDQTRENFKTRPNLKEEHNRKLAAVQSSVLRRYGELKEAIKAWEVKLFLSNNREPSFDDAKSQHMDYLLKKRDLATNFWTTGRYLPALHLQLISRQQFPVCTCD